jgi:hypothetical protein
MRAHAARNAMILAERADPSAIIIRVTCGAQALERVARRGYNKSDAKVKRRKTKEEDEN